MGAHGFDRLAWYKAPDDGMDITGSLTDFAFTLERYLPGLQMAHLLTSPERMAALLPLLAQLMEEQRALIVIDNAESLLSEAGQWRDATWGQVVRALLAHRGHGRLIRTSRRVPTDLTGRPEAWPDRAWDSADGQGEGPRAEVLAVDALSPDETLLLARELPGLRALIFGEVPGLAPGDSQRLALGVLNVAQGHPSSWSSPTGRPPGRTGWLR
ncbi:MAG TPA: hypothetical protein VH478_17850 [Trebonia sp.]|nr:hypothetical protein [Trebonia sp.]